MLVISVESSQASAIFGKLADRVEIYRIIGMNAGCVQYDTAAVPIGGLPALALACYNEPVNTQLGRMICVNAAQPTDRIAMAAID
ncbi:MAG: hypothetical protein U0Z44_09465 [Kouleothrix sp.]|nr:hypothetical protein [Kouleothrix sp.]